VNLKNILFRITHWESWEWRIKYIPIMPAWFWYCFRSGSLWFFTSSNPTLTFGGFEGEPKKEMYEQLPPGSFPKTIYIPAGTSFSEAEGSVTLNNFEYPFIVKPDVGMMGLMFRKINTAEEFKQYHQKMPFDYIVQELIQYPIEVSAFYYRFPDSATGTITGFLRKESLQVTGDGKATLLQLILDYPRVRFRLEEMKLKHADKLDDVIPEGEIFHLSYASNLSRGGKLVNIGHEKDARLLKVFDDLSNYSKHFYYGRYDIKCASIEDLKQGKNFLILEYNGSGAEPNHAYGDNKTLFQAYKIFLHHWKVLYKISKHNYNTGIAYWEFKKGWKFFKESNRYFKTLRQIDAEFPAS
jgi:hypothetical protein